MEEIPAANLQAAVEIANLPTNIRDFSHVRASHLDATLPRPEILVVGWSAEVNKG